MANMLGNLRHNWMRYPITTTVIVAAVALFLAVEIYAMWNHVSVHDARWKLGAVVNLSVVATPDLHGPLGLWDGQWWRIPASAFHHGNPLHLIMNCLGLWFLGTLLEPRMSRLGYFSFMLFATFIPMLPEYYAENNPIGLSGMAYAMFGVLVVSRKYDYEVAEAVTDSVVKMGIGWLFLCVLLTVSDILPVANLAHFSGFGYGWLIGQFYFRPERLSAFGLWSVRAAHLLVVPAVFLAMHPFWIGRYHGYRSVNEPNLKRRLTDINAALLLDKRLPSIWRALAGLQLQHGAFLDGWTSLLQCLKHNGPDQTTVKFCQTLWRQFMSPADRQQALERLVKVFGDEHEAWQQRLEISPNDLLPTDPEMALDDLQLLPPGEFATPEFPKPGIAEHDLSAPPVDPDSPDSASVGTSL